MIEIDWTSVGQCLADHDPVRVAGKVRSAKGLLLSCQLPAAVGDQCDLVGPGGRTTPAEVIGFAGDLVYVVGYEDGGEVSPGMTVVNRGHRLRLPLGRGLLGRVLDGLGRPLDDAGPLTGCVRRPVQVDTPPALRRSRIRDVFVTGQRAVDGLLTLGRGQRVGIFAGSGVGKSTLLGEIARGAEADVNVIALIGERGREVQPFLDDCLGPDGRARSVVFVATCDQTPMMRVRTAQSALAVADSFRAGGANVLLMLDSMTRLAMAQRELGLALGEPPSARGYTPSVFQLLANFIERLGNAETGSITGLLTVLVEGGDLDEPITDAIRSFVDGHVVLDRKLAEAGHYPAISVAQSISRVAHDVTDAAHQEAARKVRAALATHAEVEDLLRIGAYVKGAMPAVDRALELRPAILDFLRQRMGERAGLAETKAALQRVAAGWSF
jgi:flagellum-specific ATP synthase